MIFTPKWKKEAIHLYKGAKKFIHYKRDLLADDRISEIESRRADLKAAWTGSGKEETKEAAKQLQSSCEQALPRYKSPDAIAENVEVIFVAIVVALGLRAYYIQPFRIPTGSMRPTLNGIIGHIQPKDKWPALPVRLSQEVTHGRSYLSVVNEQADDRVVSITDGQAFHFFTRTTITFASGKTQSVSGSKTAFLETINVGGLEKIKQGPINSSPYAILQELMALRLPAGFVIAEGYIETGDLVLVDKFSYHFKSPTPGEVFVFDTRDIKKIHADAKRTNSVAGSHYIKRLIAVPGQRVELKGGTPNFERRGTGVVPVLNQASIFIDGKKMQAPGVLLVESAKDGFRGYQATNLLAPGRYVKLADRPSTGKSEYWAQGDNSYSSSDSRMWGTVKEFNLVGPAMFVLWPFGSGHWGSIN